MSRPRLGEEKGASEGLALRVTPEMRKRILEVATSQGVGMAQVIRDAIEDYVARDERKKSRQKLSDQK